MIKKIKFWKLGANQLLFLFFPFCFLVYKTHWWIEDFSIRKEGLKRIVILLKQPKLKEANILYFSGTHDSMDKRDFGGRHYILHSATEIRFTNLILTNFRYRSDVMELKGFLEQEIGHSVGDILGIGSGRADFGDIGGISIRETKSTSGFYYEIQHSWLQ